MDTVDQTARLADVDPLTVSRQLERILGSPAFKATQRRRQFLQYIVREDAAGHCGNLKGYAIAVAVYGRDASFDTRIDPLVRLEAGRLRADLEHYYQTDGQNDPILIEIPKGANAPRYTVRSLASTDELPATRLAEKPAVSAVSLDLPLSAAAKPRQRRGIYACLVIAVLALVGLAGTSWTSIRQPVRPASTKIASVAVLPFVVQNGDAAQGSFAHGLSQELAMKLFQFPDLQVTPPNSIDMARQADGLAFRRSLGTTSFVEGSVLKRNDVIRISVRLINTTTGVLLWGETFERPLQAEQILDLQVEIAGLIASTVGSTTGVIARDALKASLAKAPSTLDALDCVLRFYQHQVAMTAEGHREARTCLEATVKAEPNYAAAWAGLAYVYAQEYRIGLNAQAHGIPAVERAYSAARQALLLAPHDAGAMMVKANTLFDQGDWDGFKRLAEAAIKTRPGDPGLMAHYGLRVAMKGDWKEGAALVQRAISMNAQHYPGWYGYPIILSRYLDGDYDGALALLPGLPSANFISADFFSAMINGKAGRLDAAQVAAERVRIASPDIAQKFWPVFRAWKLSEQTLDQFADGLRKAGVAIDPGAQAVKP